MERAGEAERERVAIQLVVAGDFALLGPSIYADREGKRGSYTFGRDGTLSMITGPLKGSVYLQIANDALKLIQPQGRRDRLRP